MARNIADQEIAQARASAARMRAAGLAATSVRFDPQSRRILLDLSNGALLGIPVSSLPNIAGATNEDLATVELLGESIVHVETLDADYSVAGLVTNLVGQMVAARALGRLGGAAVTSAKKEAARRNGAKGGRPPLYRGTPAKGKGLLVRETSSTAHRLTAPKKTAKGKLAKKK